jgi:hypothetical protein
MERWQIKLSKNQIWADAEGRWAKIQYLRADNVQFYCFKTGKARVMARAAFEKKFCVFKRGGGTPPVKAEPRATA